MPPCCDHFGYTRIDFLRRFLVVTPETPTQLIDFNQRPCIQEARERFENGPIVIGDLSGQFSVLNST